MTLDYSPLQPIKAPESVSTIITSESLFYKVWGGHCFFSVFIFKSDHIKTQNLRLCSQGVYYQIGDVIRVIDEDDGKPYYAQIRGFVQDQYCEKSAALTWLIPTQASPSDHFDPGTYIIGKRSVNTFYSDLFDIVLSSVLFIRTRGGSAQEDGLFGVCVPRSL